MPVKTYDFAAVLNSVTHRLQVFAVGEHSGQVYTCELNTNDPGDWRNGEWARIGGPSDMRQLAVAQNADGTLELFGVRDNGRVVHNKQTSTGLETYGSWGPWEDIGAIDWKAVVIGTNADGRLEVFALVGPGQLFHMWQESPGGVWSGTGFFSRDGWKTFTLGRNADGRLQLFAIGPDDSAYTTSQVSPNGGWNDWSHFGGISWESVTNAQNPDGRIELFAIAGGDAYHVWQTAPNNGWSGAASFGATDLRFILAASNADGRLELFAIGGNYSIYHIWMTAPNNGWRPQWSPLGVSARQFLVAPDEHGRLVVLYTPDDGYIHVTGQAVPNGDWLQPQPGILSDPEPQPQVRLWADKTDIQQGESTRLQWESSNADALSIDQGIGPVGPHGISWVSPRDTTLYTITASTPVWTVTDTQRINVEPPVTPPPPVGASGVPIYNCTHETLYLWRRDVTAGEPFVMITAFDSQVTEFGACGPGVSTPYIMPLPIATHLYEVVAVQNSLPGCDGSPYNGSCRKQDFSEIANPNAPLAQPVVIFD